MFRFQNPTLQPRRNPMLEGMQTGLNALALAQQNIPHYAVVDLKMPGPSGLVLVSQLRQLNSEMRIVMLTG